PNGTVTVEARSANISNARAQTAGGAIVQVSADIHPEATTRGTTNAWLLGHVRQGTGSSATAGANTVEVSSQGYDLATSVFDTTTGGAINIGLSTASHATVGSQVGAQIGTSGSVVLVTAAVRVTAASITDADAATRSASGGAINVQSFGATVHDSPNIAVSAGGGASITAGTVTIEATHNTTPPVYSDGVFTGVTSSDA